MGVQDVGSSGSNMHLQRVGMTGIVVKFWQIGYARTVMRGSHKPLACSLLKRFSSVLKKGGNAIPPTIPIRRYKHAT